MHLTDEEKLMLAGGEGEAVRFAMQILTKIGSVYGAERMVPVHSVHAGCVYANLGAAVEMMEKFADLGGRFRAQTTANPILNPRNYDLWPELQEPDKLKKAAVRQLNAIRRMGVIPNWSCTPYFQGNVPRFGEPAAWQESSASIFVNSVLGGRTNRTSPGMDVASSIAGRVPEFGLLLDENRVGNALAKLEFHPKSLFDYSTIGFIIGKAFGGKVPVIEGLPCSTTANQLKAMGAAMATSGGNGMYHAVGISPEARTKEDAFRGRKPELEMDIQEKDVEAAVEELNTIKSDRIDAVLIGCPHATPGEIKEVAELLNGRKVRQDIHLCLFSAGDAVNWTRQMGYIDVIESAGVKIFEGDCIVFHSTKAWGWKNVATNSARWACVLPCYPFNLKVRYTDIRECIELATE